jgi:hypothetical protein
MFSRWLYGWWILGWLLGTDWGVRFSFVFGFDFLDMKMNFCYGCGSVFLWSGRL